MTPARRTTLRLMVVAVLALGALPARAALAAGSPPAGTGKGGSHRPVTPGATHGNGRIIAVLPDGSLRELCTAFTQVTESPFTLADGKSETSVDAVSASAAKLDTLHSHSIEAGGIGYTRGLRGRWDVGLSVTPWSGLGLHTGPVNGDVTPAGFGGGAVKVRHTFFGVDSEGVALGIVGAVRVPGASASPGSTEFEGSLSVPVSASLPFDFTLGAMAQGGTLADAEGTGHHARWIGSAQLEHDLVPHVSGWIEGVSVWDREPNHPWLGTIDAGVSVELGHVALGLGGAVGRSAAASDAGVFVGLGLHP